MHPALKVLAVLLALPVLLFGGAFLYGGYLGLTGQLELEPDGPVAQEHAAGDPAPAAGETPEPAAPTGPARDLAPLPDPLDAQAAGD